MSRDALLSTGSKVTLLFTFVGLTAWYLAGEFADSAELKLLALFGLGIVVPTAINEWRRHRSDSRPGDRGPSVTRRRVAATGHPPDSLYATSCQRAENPCTVRHRSSPPYAYC